MHSGMCTRLNSPLFYCRRQDTPSPPGPPISGQTWTPRDHQSQQSESLTHWHRRTGFLIDLHQRNPENTKIKTQLLSL